MHKYLLFIQINIQYALTDGREKIFFAVISVDDINVIGAGLKYIFDCTEILSLICNNIQSDQIDDKIFILFSLYCILARNKDIFFSVFFYVVYVIIAFKF